MSTTNTTADDSSHILVNNPHAENASHIFVNRKHDDELKGSAAWGAGAGGVWSDPYSGGILDVFFSRPTFLRTMSARAFANYKCVCKSWARWYHANTHIIAHASSDWYFPLFGKVEEGHTEMAWSGIWHSDASHKELELSPLPSLGYLQSIPGLGSHLEHEILATAGGLLLTTSRRILRRNMPLEARPSVRLVVSNPLTKQVRVLPFLHTLSPLGDGCPVYMHMLVDDKANTCKVIVYWYSGGPAIQVYDSTSMSWELVLGEHPWMRPMLGAGQTCNGCGGRYYTSAYIHGRIYFADIRAGTDMEVQNDPLLHGVLRLFEAGIRDGTWKSSGEFPLRRSCDRRVKMFGLLIDNNTVSTMHNMELVECKGRFFAVIPSRLDQVVHPWGPVPPGYAADAAVSSKYLPVQFYVLQLEGSVH